MLHPPRRAIRATEREEAASLGLVDVRLRTADGLALSAWESTGPACGSVVLVHGLGNNRASLLPEAKILLQRGHGVLLLDSRASGESEGRTATWGDSERLDVQAALDHLQQRGQTRLGAYGFSVGATAVALTAAADPRVGAVALGPTWPALSEELEAKFGQRFFGLSARVARWAFARAGIHIDALRPGDRLAESGPRPLLLFSGTRDADTPPPVMARLAARLPWAQVALLSGVQHGDHAQAAPEQFARLFGGFFDRAFGCSGGAPAARPSPR